MSGRFVHFGFLTSRLISRQVTSSVYVGEKVSDFTQLVRSSARNVGQFLLSSSRVRCSLARQLVNLSLGVWPYAIEAAARQLAVTSQLGTLSAAMAARVVRRAAKTSNGQNEMPMADAAAIAIINRRNMTISQIACNLSFNPRTICLTNAVRSVGIYRECRRIANRDFMSALPPRANMCGATADIRFGPKADTHGVQQIRPLLDHLVGAAKQ